MITGTFTTAEHLRHHHDLHNRDIGHLKERCNCETSTDFCTLNHGHMSLNTTGMSTNFSKNDMHNQDVGHIINEQLGNLHGFLNRRNSGDSPLRHNRDIDDLADELQMRRTAVFCTVTTSTCC